MSKTVNRTDMCAKKKVMIYDHDEWLEPYKEVIDRRQKMILELKDRYSVGGSLANGLNNHMYYGLHRNGQGNWVFREWAPNATKIYLIGEFNNWKRTEAYALKPLGGGNWEIVLPSMFLDHGTLYKLYIEWKGGGAERLPAYVTRTVQDPHTKTFCAQVWDPFETYEWKNGKPGKRPNPLIYECHIGMAAEEEKVGTFEEFRLNVLPKVAELGYDTLQIMALQEHPYYGSFGYQVSNFFAPSSKYGYSSELKDLIDTALSLGHSVLAITDHEAVSNAIKAQKYYYKKKKDNPDFKLILGNEIYLCRDGLTSETFTKGEDKFYHFILLAKDAVGWQQLKELCE